MADTGAPWNLPYPLPTDLVRDGADAIKDLAEATATGLSAAGSEGIGPNVVQTVKTDVFSTTAGTYTAISGLDATITPSSATAKVLVIAYVVLSTGGGPSDRDALIRLTAGGNTPFIGDAATGKERVTLAFGWNSSVLDMRRGTYAATIVYLHSPMTTSPITYGLETRSQDGGVSVNRAWNDNFGRTASSITLIEVAA